ncbi:hypothetical protein Sjap_022718 [Stephania japonica]|uniref:WAT1-related protein n=1 Tax=Stephania japonica TaxID=461633 RepID=A0AAP0EPE8_9MAGN
MGIDKKSYFYVVLIQVIYVGYYILTKSAYNGGTNNFVFVFYRQFLATLILVPFAILFERMETLKPKTVKGMAKIVGLGLSLGGAIVLAFYKGPHLKPIMHRHLLGRRSSSTATSEGRTWITGAFINLAANVVWGLWIVMQAKVLESYPSKLLLTTLQCALSAIQTFFVAIIFTRDLHPWKLHLDIGLLAIAYAGILTTAAVFYLQTCCLQRRGPVFFAMSTPLSFIFTMICSYVILGESITLGR